MNQIKSERVRQGYTQDGLAQKLNVTRQTVINWEQGDVDLKVSTVLELAELFGCSTDYLLGLSAERLPR